MGKIVSVFVVVTTLLAVAGLAIWQTQPELLEPITKEVDSITTNIKPVTQSPTINITRYELETHELINKERIRYGIKPLEWNDDLATAARQHSTDMAKTMIFNHGTRYCHGENIVMSTDWMYPAQAVKSWMESYGHKENILRKSFTEAGIGIAISDSGATYYTQNFSYDVRRC